MSKFNLLFFISILSLGVACQHKTSTNTAGTKAPTGRQLANVEKRPALLINNPQILGQYSPATGVYCQDEGRGICQSAKIEKKGADTFVVFANDPKYSMTLSQKKDVLFFTQNFEMDCDNPGCGNLGSIYGIVYYKKINGQWALTIKVTTVVDFPFPDEEDAPEGLVTSSAHLFKQ
jgi:hypothetical protein